MHIYSLTYGQPIMIFLYDGTWCQLHPEGYANFDYDIYQDTFST